MYPVQCVHATSRHGTPAADHTNCADGPGLFRLTVRVPSPGWLSLPTLGGLSCPFIWASCCGLAANKPKEAKHSSPMLWGVDVVLRPETVSPIGLKGNYGPVEQSHALSAQQVQEGASLFLSGVHSVKDFLHWLKYLYGHLEKQGNYALR